MITSFFRGIIMEYAKLVEMVPKEQLGPLSERLIGVILGAKNDKIPNNVANIILMDMKTGNTASKKGITNLLEVAVFLDVENTILTLGELKLLNIVSEIIQS
jgi:hypothetical protein